METLPVSTTSSMPPLKVVIFVSQMEGGGAQAAAVKLATGLRSSGFHAETWFGYKKRDTYRDVPYVRCLLPARPSGPFAVFQFGMALRHELKKHSPDVLITFTHYANVVGQFTGTLLRIPVRIASQRAQVSSVPRGAALADAILGSLGAYCANVMVSETVRNGFRFHPRPYRRRAIVIPNGVTGTDNAIGADTFPLRSKLGLPHGAFLVGSVGRLASVKNTKSLVKMVALTRNSNVHLVLVGDGPEREFLKRSADSLGVASRVHFLGDVPHRAVGSVLRELDAFALASYSEGMSNSVLEALAAGLPVIVSDIPAQREVLDARGRSYGILVQPENAQMWADAIDSLVERPQERAHFAEVALERAADFAVDLMVERFAALIHSHSIERGRIANVES